MASRSARHRSSAADARRDAIEKYEVLYDSDAARRSALRALRSMGEGSAAKGALGAARGALEAWASSGEPVGSRENMERLEKAARGAELVLGDESTNPADKMRALSILIRAAYHRTALAEVGEPNWLQGKKEAHRLLKNYVIAVPMMRRVAKDELSKNFIGRMLDTKTKKEKRWELLREFSNASASAAFLRPLGMNRSRPQFPELEEAVMHACDLDLEIMGSAIINQFMTEPKQRSNLPASNRGVYCLAIFKDGTKVVAGSGDGSIKILNVATGGQILTLKGHRKRVCCCCLFMGDNRLVSGSWDGTLKLWDLNKAEEILTMRGHTSIVWCCSVYDRDNRLVSGGGDGVLKVWDLPTGKELLSLKGHSDEIRCCHVFSDGTRLASGSSDKSLKIWNLKEGTEMITLVGHTKAVLCCSSLGGGKYLVSGGYEGTLRIWNIATGKVTCSLAGHTDPVTCCSVLRGETVLVSGSEDKTVKIWDLLEAEELHSFEGHSRDVKCCSAFENDCRIATGSLDGFVKIWELPLPRIFEDM